MKRFRLLGCGIMLCGMLVGCGSETRESLVTATIQSTEFAATDVESITTQVKKATEDVEKGTKTKLDLTEAAKAADQLKARGTKIVEIRQAIDRVRSTITEEEKKSYAENQKAKITKAMETLNERRTELRKALAAAEKHGKVQVDELRKKIVEAEGPFEAQAR